MAQSNPFFKPASAYLDSLLWADAGELRENDLLAWLRSQQLVPDTLADQALYRLHFLMRNALYRAADARPDYQWQFSPLGVAWQLRAEGVQAVSTGSSAGRLRDYYLNLDNLSLSAEEVAELLAQFWDRYRRYEADARGDAKEALALLGLDQLTDLDTLKRQYRRKVMALHPDRGGDKSALQAINSAYARLKQLAEQA